MLFGVLDWCVLVKLAAQQFVCHEVNAKSDCEQMMCDCTHVAIAQW
jgi:hypothetical protein